MKAAIFDEVGTPLRIGDMADPAPGPDEVVLRVEACGICGSDLHMTHDPAPFGLLAPFVLGHEIAGEVVALGAEVADLREGTASPSRRCAAAAIATPAAKGTPHAVPP